MSDAKGTHTEVAQLIASTSRRGAEVFALDLDHALAARGRAVRTVALTEGRDAAQLDVPAFGPPLGPRELRDLRAFVTDASLSVAHGSKSVPACAVATLGTGRPFVYRNIGDPAQWATTWLRRQRVGWYMSRARSIVALWPGAADTLMRLYGLPAARIEIIANGAPASRFPVVTESARRNARIALDLADDDQILVFLGALTEEKNCALMLNALALLPGVTLVVAGAGPQRAELEILAAAVAPGRVRFLGGVADPQSVLAVADVLVLPSRTEGLPAVAIEAGFTGIPVVATDVGGVSEIVRDGETGFVVAPGDVDALARGVRAALDAPRDMGRLAREHCVNRFEIGVVAAAWDDLLTHLIAS